jgi:outer membrane protein OmpA-like peptidoglycan-associated protein
MKFNFYCFLFLSALPISSWADCTYKVQFDGDKSRVVNNDMKGCGMTVRISTTTTERKRLAVNYEFNSAILQTDPQTIKELSDLADTLRKEPRKIVTIEGHTDNVGSANYNYDLSRRRALSVKRYLEENENIPSDQMQIIGYGFDHPIALNVTEKGRAMNRRMEISFSISVRREFNSKNDDNSGPIKEVLPVQNIVRQIMNKNENDDNNISDQPRTTVKNQDPAVDEQTSEASNVTQ